MNSKLKVAIEEKINAYIRGVEPEDVCFQVRMAKIKGAQAMYNLLWPEIVAMKQALELMKLTSPLARETVENLKFTKDEK